MITDDVHLRPARPDDAAALAAAYRRNRAHLRPWEPERAEEFFTARGQEAALRERLAQRQAGRMMPWVLTDADGSRILGTFTLANIALGAFRSANLGYWIDSGHTGRGLATAAVEFACRAAREELGLHRLEAGTLLENVASQRVLAKAGFEPIGTARRYLHINGAWRDHRLFQRILHDGPPGGSRGSGRARGRALLGGRDSPVDPEAVTGA